MSHTHQRPVIHDLAQWSQVVNEHNRILFERFIRELPEEVQKAKWTEIEVWRTRLSGVKTSYTSVENVPVSRHVRWM